MIDLIDTNLKKLIAYVRGKEPLHDRANHHSGDGGITIALSEEKDIQLT